MRRENLTKKVKFPGGARSYRVAAPSRDLKFKEACASAVAFSQLQLTFMGAAQLLFVRPATGQAQLQVVAPTQLLTPVYT